MRTACKRKPISKGSEHSAKMLNTAQYVDKDPINDETHRDTKNTTRYVRGGYIMFSRLVVKLTRALSSRGSNSTQQHSSNT